ncbi:hypothetical protein N658DRAFT_501833 [Parathielavia hyrcaniae]|uniref:Uncharacterized protein n=1 Tax=Parathielavia hyrcaniae TaxID=113614 RepID=A0AAN6PQP7_9PEZI|nr:hypothetical protein N658DRAFT_501833 [Parathielavia hyrcaniae]
MVRWRVEKEQASGLFEAWRRRAILPFAQLQLMTQQARANASPEVVPAENPFVFPEWRRLRNDCKRRWATEAGSRRPFYFVYNPLSPLARPLRICDGRYIFGARIPFPVRGREPTAA